MSRLKLRCLSSASDRRDKFSQAAAWAYLSAHVYSHVLNLPHTNLSRENRAGPTALDGGTCWRPWAWCSRRGWGVARREAVGRPESDARLSLFPRMSTGALAGKAVMVRIEVGSGCERPNATKRANHDDRQNDADGTR